MAKHKSSFGVSRQTSEVFGTRLSRKPCAICSPVHLDGDAAHVRFGATAYRALSCLFSTNISATMTI
jgi:hypothetical protein